MKKEYTAWQLAGDWWWEKDHQAVRLHGNVRWDAVSVTPRQNSTVRLARLDPVLLCAIVDYVPPETKMRLVKK